MPNPFLRPIQEMKGVSKYRFARLKRLDLYTEGDLLRYFPELMKIGLIVIRFRVTGKCRCGI